MRRYHLNVPIVVFLALMVLVALLAMNNQNNLLFWIFGAMVALLLISGLVSGLMMIGVEVYRLDPGHGTVGEPLVVRYRVTNRNRLFAAFSLHVEDLDAPPVPRWRRVVESLRALSHTGYDLTAAARESARRRRDLSTTTFWRFMSSASAWIMYVAPGTTVHGESVYWPIRRGVAHFQHIRLWTTFPFGLVKKSITINQPAHTLVYPRLYGLKRGVLGALTPSGPPGEVVSTRSGTGDDYFGLREYRPGDPLRHIAWKRTAARDEIVCIEHARSSPPRVRVVLNLTAGPSADLATLEEQAIALAASVVHAADAAGFEVGLSVLGLPVPPLPVRHSSWHCVRIHAALAEIDLTMSRDAYAPEDMGDTEQVGLIIVHADRIDPGMGRSDAWHLSARQLDQLIDVPLGWNPSKNDRWLARHLEATESVQEPAA